MAKVYSAPSNLSGKSIDYRSRDTWAQQEADRIERLADMCRARVPNNDYVGEVIQFPFADGYARYMVANTAPAELIHLCFGDAWRVPDAHERGIDTHDIKASVDQARAQKALFDELSQNK